MSTGILHPMVWGISVNLLMLILQTINLFLPCRKKLPQLVALWGHHPPPYGYPYHWFILDSNSNQDKVTLTNVNDLPKLQILTILKNCYMCHTFWSCLIKCVNMKWIQQVLLKILSGHDGWIRGNQFTPLSSSLKRGYNDISQTNYHNLMNICTASIIQVFITWPNIDE